MNLRQGCSSPTVIQRNVIRDRIPGVVNAYDQQQKRRPRHCKQCLIEIIQNQVPDAEGNLIPASVRPGVDYMLSSEQSGWQRSVMMHYRQLSSTAALVTCVIAPRSALVV